MATVGIIPGSTRPNRFSIEMANWLLERGHQRGGDVEYELVDLADYHLPFLGHVPDTTSEDTPRLDEWCSTIDRLDGFIFVSPEYNHSTTAVLKNAIDLVSNREWGRKPAGMVSYGGRAGGGRAIEHLRQILAELRVFDLREQVTIPNFREHVRPDGTFDFTSSTINSADAMLDELEIWVPAMKAVREQIAAREQVPA